METDREVELAKQALIRNGLMNPSDRDIMEVVWHVRKRQGDPPRSWGDLWDEGAILIIGYDRLLVRPFPTKAHGRDEVTATNIAAVKVAG